MKIGILTFHAVHNFGAVLQAYGLQEFLRMHGFDAHIVDYRPKYLFDVYKSFSFNRIFVGSILQRLKLLFREIIAYPIRKCREKHFEVFVNEYIQPSSLDLLDVNNSFDAFVFGSDQIWNPIICNGLDSIFLGDFSAANGRKLVSYAASLGSTKHINEEQRDELVDKLSKFSAISCREYELSNFISESLHRKVTTVLDPVLLVGRDVYDKIATRMDNVKPYVLLFTLSNNDSARNIAYSIAKENKMQIVEIMSYQIAFLQNNIKHVVSVPDFLGYLRSAEIVVTSSFHGTALSVLFEKEFYYVPDDPKTAERAANLLQTLGVGRRIWCDGKGGDNEMIDYSIVYEILDVEREKSLAYIKESLK